MTAPFPQLVAGDPPTGPNSLTVAERQKLAESVVGLCIDRANKAARSASEYRGKRYDPEELAAEAMLAAVEAAAYWQPGRGVKFSTYVVGYIDQHFATVTDGRYTVPLGELADPGDVPDRDGDGDGEPVTRTPNEYQSWLMSKLTEPTRTVVRLVAFEGLTPDQAAERLGVEPKDAKLMIRNAADVIRRITEADIQAEENIETAVAAAAG